jgi:hypothetical protein
LVFVQRPPPSDQRGGRLVGFEDGVLAWTKVPGRTVVLGPDPENDRYTKPYNIQKVLVIPGLPHPKIAMLSLHYEDAPCQVLIFNHEFRIVGEYWHPGHLTSMELGDFDQDGRVELLLGGVNNRHHSATVVALDPDNVAGTTRRIVDPRVPDQSAFGLLKYGEDDAHLSDILPGTEKYVILFPRSYLLFEGTHALHLYNRVQHMKPFFGGLTVVVAENEVEDALENIIYDLDWQMNVVAAKPSKRFQDIHWERFQKHTLDHPFRQRDIDQLRKHVVVMKYR